MLQVAAPLDPVYGGPSWEVPQNFRRAEIGVTSCHLIRAHWGPKYTKIAAAAVSLVRLTLLIQRRRIHKLPPPLQKGNLLDFA